LKEIIDMRSRRLSRWHH